ncbi:hypothetical protein LOK49_LG02G01391 [Camellia lanceoleosa]|uniref:Uncharacterized protein n=1 Tax=Camellia lanceoleosa TaxID=1840588 RepID=A0ACC0IHL6_9ERIC|nr:hypothetical protein LOK49_LG02G01391 [Camellia lanceoleosa]
MRVVAGSHWNLSQFVCVCVCVFFFFVWQPLPTEEEKELKETLQDIIGQGKKVRVERKAVFIANSNFCAGEDLLGDELLGVRVLFSCGGGVFSAGVGIAAEEVSRGGGHGVLAAEEVGMEFWQQQGWCSSIAFSGGGYGVFSGVSMKIRWEMSCGVMFAFKMEVQLSGGNLAD